RRTLRGGFSTADASCTARRNGARVGGQSGARASLLGAIRAGPRANRRGKWEAPRNAAGKFLIRSDTGPRYRVRTWPPWYRDRQIESARGDFRARLAGGPRCGCWARARSRSLGAVPHDTRGCVQHHLPRALRRGTHHELPARLWHRGVRAVAEKDSAHPHAGWTRGGVAVDT